MTQRTALVGASTGVTRFLVRVVPCCHRRECSHELTAPDAVVHRSIPHHAWPSCDERGVRSAARDSRTACTRKAALASDVSVGSCSRRRSSTIQPRCHHYATSRAVSAPRETSPRSRSRRRTPASGGDHRRSPAAAVGEPSRQD